MFNRTYSMVSLTKSRNFQRKLFRLSQDNYLYNSSELLSLKESSASISRDSMLSLQRTTSQKFLPNVLGFYEVYLNHIKTETRNSHILKNISKESKTFLKYYDLSKPSQLKLINSNEFMNGIIEEYKKANIKLPKLAFTDNILFKTNPLLIMNSRLEKYYLNIQCDPITSPSHRKPIDYLNKIHKAIVFKTADKELDIMNRNNIFQFQKIKKEPKLSKALQKDNDQYLLDIKRTNKTLRSFQKADDVDHCNTIKPVKVKPLSPKMVLKSRRIKTSNSKVSIKAKKLYNQIGNGKLITLRNKSEEKMNIKKASEILSKPHDYEKSLNELYNKAKNLKVNKINSQVIQTYINTKQYATIKEVSPKGVNSQLNSLKGKLNDKKIKRIHHKLREFNLNQEAYASNKQRYEQTKKMMRTMLMINEKRLIKLSLDDENR